MRDPHEGVSPQGTIVTGARRDRVPGAFEPILAIASDVVADDGPQGSLYLYGSVATGQARVPTSDVDLITIDVDPEVAGALGRALSRGFRDRCRSVEVAAAATRDYVGDSDAAYGNRVFLRHHCVHLTGLSPHESLPDHPADARAARGFNGDIAIHARRWRRARQEGADPAVLGRRVARKALLALAGLVSVHDRTWTTDRAGSARRWAEIEPGWRDELGRLVRWADGDEAPTRAQVDRVLAGFVDHLVATFDARIGLWR